MSKAIWLIEIGISADPGFYNQNTVMIGKTMIKMGNKESAKEYLLNALKYEDKTVDDTNVSLAITVN